jgi:hypothetical protein
MATHERRSDSGGLSKLGKALDTKVEVLLLLLLLLLV